MDKETKLLLLKFNQVCAALSKSGVEVKPVLNCLNDAFNFPEVRDLLKALPTNIEFQLCDLHHSFGAYYNETRGAKKACIQINRHWVKEKPSVAAVFLLHEMRHHIQLTEQKNVLLQTPKEKMFLDLMNEAEARVQDLAIMTRLMQKEPAKYRFDAMSFRTIPLPEYQKYLYQNNNDFSAANAYFFKSFLDGENKVGKAWRDVYLKQAKNNARFHSGEKFSWDKGSYEKLLKKYASRFGLSAEQMALFQGSAECGKTLVSGQILKQKRQQR